MNSRWFTGSVNNHPVRQYHLFVIALLLAILLSAQPILAQSKTTLLESKSQQMSYRVELLTEGLGVPWGMAFIDWDTILFTERAGKIGKFTIHSGKVTYLSGVPEVWAKGQGGMMDVALPKNYVLGGWIYFTYSKPRNNIGVTTLARAKLGDNSLREWQDLLLTKSETDTTRHFGSRIAFDNNGHLFFSVGDRGYRPNGQDLTTHAGSVLRVNLDGSVPADNPFVNSKNVLPEIWSYGHRNPQGLAYDEKNQRLWLIEHGPRGGDEINLVLPGSNYGWPVVSHGKEYFAPIAVGEGKFKSGIEPPRKVYIPSIAPGSLLLYSGKAFPAWRGSLFAGALKLAHLNRIEVNDNVNLLVEERLLETLNERIRDVLESPEGWLYLSTDSGKILRIIPTH